MHFSKVVIIWAAWFLVQVISIPIPVDKPLEDLPILTYKQGDIVGVRPHEYEKKPPKEISIHPGVVVDGPNHEGKYSVAMISKKLPHNPPQADIKEFHSNANIYGNVALSPPKQARPKGMKPWKSEKTGEQAIPLDKKGVKKLKNAMVPHAHWREPTPPPESPPPTPPPVQPHPPKSKKPRRSSPGTDHGNSGGQPHLPPHGSVYQAGPSHYHGAGQPYHVSSHYKSPSPARHDPYSSYSQRRPPSPGSHPRAGPSRASSKNPYGHPAPGQHDNSAPPQSPAPYHGPSGYHAGGPSPFVPPGPHRPADSLYHKPPPHPARPPSHGPSAHAYRPPPPPFPVPHHYAPQEIHLAYHVPHAYDNTPHTQSYSEKPLRPPSSGVHPVAQNYVPQHTPQHPTQHPSQHPMAPYGSQHMYHSPPGYHVDAHGQHIVPQLWHPSERPVQHPPATHPKPSKGPSRHSTI